MLGYIFTFLSVIGAMTYSVACTRRRQADHLRLSRAIEDLQLLVRTSVLNYLEMTDPICVMVDYIDEIRRCEYGSFRGTIKEGKVVEFAVEHEWRPQKEKKENKTKKGWKPGPKYQHSDS